MTGGSSSKLQRRAQHLLVRAPHALRVMTPFGMPVEPEVNRNFA